jgi:uncharacterized protein (DUF1501 family)
MQQDDLKTLLSTFAAERLAILQRLEAAARVVSHYDFNNTYQYVISRQETHVSWVQNALAEFSAPLPAAATALPAPTAPKVVKKVDVSAYRGILEEDAKSLSAFVLRWRPRLETMTHARHRLMLNVVLGESQEHQRLFEQAAAGFEDVLGKRTPQAERVGAVLPTRWME